MIKSLFLAVVVMFASTQIAMAYDSCCETPTKREASQTAAHDHSNHTHDHGKKSDKIDDHCAMSSHHTLAVTKDSTLAVPMKLASVSLFSQPLFHELLVGEGLIEPPSFA